MFMFHIIFLNYIYNIPKGMVFKTFLKLYDISPRGINLIAAPSTNRFALSN